MTIIKVIGKVQGVAFRYYTKKKADELGLAGSVQNLKDGSVIIKVNGNQHGVDKLIRWCSAGSPASNVNQVLVLDQGEPMHEAQTDQNHKNDKTEFTILRG